jgi:hypothetical protein
MLNRKTIGLLFAMLAVVVAAPLGASGVCTTPACAARPCPTPMPYPGEIVTCPGCCPGPYCVPNACEWGYATKQWRPWPGDEGRIDIRYPGARGLEPVRTPPGATPAPLPKETYAPPIAEQPQTQPGPGIQIEQGAPTTPTGPTGPGQPTGPIRTPVPFELGPGFGEGLPGLPAEPQGTTPEQPPAGTTPRPITPPAPQPTTTPPTTTPPAAGTTTTPPKDTIPPAPLPEKGSFSHPAPGPLPNLDAPSPSDLVAAPLPDSPEIVGPSLDEWPATKVQPAAANSDEPLARVAEKTPLPEAAKPQASVQPWDEPGEWKSRRAQTQPPAARPAEYQEPAKTAPVGLDGYCPVELVRHEQWVDGSPQWAVVHEGRTYLMSGPAQQRFFRANPERYAPALGGCDPVLVATGAGRVAGRTETCVIYEDRLFMFRGQDTLAQFRQDPKRFAGVVTQPAK